MTRGLGTVLFLLIVDSKTSIKTARDGPTGGRGRKPDGAGVTR